MSGPSGDVWTRSNAGWVQRMPEPGDDKRRALVREWLCGNLPYKKVAKAVLDGCLTEMECAP